MYKEYFKPLGNIKAPEEAVQRAVRAAIDAEEKRKVIPMKLNNTKRKVTAISVIAASLVLVFTLGTVFFSKKDISSDPNKSAKAQHSFYISADAADLSGRLDDSVVGAFAGVSTLEHAMYDSEGKRTFPELFCSYDIKKLSIEGEDIKSVTVSSNKQGVYFAINPLPEIKKVSYNDSNLPSDKPVVYVQGKTVVLSDYKTEEEFYDACEKELSRYTDTSLKNSQYTTDEIKAYGDGVLLSQLVCDTFTYNNSSKDDSVNIYNSLTLVFESITSDKEIEKLIKELDETEKLYEQLRPTESIGKQKASAQAIACIDKMHQLYDDIRTQIVKDATIDITVTYNDGASLTKTLYVSTDPDSDLVILTDKPV